MAQAVSRRTFLSGVFTVGAVAAAGLMLPACVSSSGEGAEAGTKAGTQPSSPPASTAANRTPPSRSYPTRDYSADVIIIGGGLAGMMAARNALAQGASVILVDKGPFGRSGATGINWGHEVMSYEGASSETLGLALAPMTMAGLVDQEYYSAIIHASYEMCVLQQAVKSGAVLEMTAVPEDSPHNMKYPFLRTAEPVMPRFFAQQLRNSSVQIIDRTMVLDILQDEAGAASGVVALDLATGEGVTVTAKAVVMCTGSPCWANGWSGVGAKTNASPENTGDGLAILLGHGVPIKNIEQWDLYFYNSSPSGIAFSQGIGVSVGDHPENMLNSDGKNFLVDNPDFTSVDRPVYELLCMKEVYEGRGSSKGGLWYDITRLEEPDYVMAFNRRVPENHRRALRYVDENPCEIIPTPWECAGAPHLDKKGQTQIEGLFFASAGDQAYGGSCATVCLAGGHLAGGSAAALAAEREMPVLDAATAQAVLDGAFSALENDPPQPVRATKVMHTIQNIMNQYVWMGRTDVGLNRAVVELNRVRDELMPRMVVVDKSKTFNQEWRQAIEVPFMWANVMATAQSALARTESRGSHHRLDHPATDNSRWLKNVYVRVDDGQWSTEARGIVTELVPAPLVAVTTSEPSLV